MLKKCAFLLIQSIKDSKYLPIIALPDGNNIDFPHKVAKWR